MKSIKTYIRTLISEKLKVSANSGDPILDIVPEEWHGQFGRICLHFSNISALLMYSLEMEGQLSDGKYENSSPKDHWEWTRRSFFTVDGNDFYTGSSRFRRPNKKYNLNEWVRTVKNMLKGSDYDYDWSFTIRLFDYGRIGRCITKDELKSILTLNTGGLVSKIYINDYIGTIAEAFGDALRKNPECTYEEMKAGLRSYEQSAFARLPQFDKEDFFERFKNTEYTFKEFKADYDSMCRTINTPNFD